MNEFLTSPVGLALLNDNTYLFPKHLQVLDDVLLDVFHGKIKRLIVNMPPRHGKSELISKYFPAWYLMHKPDNKVIIATYGADLSKEWGMQVRDLITEFGKYRNVSLSNSSKSASRFHIKGRRGVLFTAGVGGPLTGKGAHVLIVDDPVKNDEQALSKTYRDKTHRWFNVTASTRLEKNASIILIMTRWHHDDLAGRLIEHNPDGWTVLNLPAFADGNDPLGREIGEPLWEWKYDKEALEDIRMQLGTYWFDALYQQKPVANENQIVKRHWWNFYQKDTLPKMEYTIQVWDTAFGTNENNDYTACGTVGYANKNFYILDIYREKLAFPDLERALVSMYNRHKPNDVYVEYAGSGISLIQTIKKATKIPIKGKEVANKELRVHSISPLFEQGRVFAHQSMTSMLEEFDAFPYGKKDDQVDVVAHALQVLQSKSTVRTMSNVQSIRKNYFTL